MFRSAGKRLLAHLLREEARRYVSKNTARARRSTCYSSAPVCGKIVVLRFRFRGRLCKMDAVHMDFQSLILAEAMLQCQRNSNFAELPTNHRSLRWSSVLGKAIVLLLGLLHPARH